MKRSISLWQPAERAVDPNSGPKQLASAYLLNLEARIKAVHKHVDQTQLNGPV